MTVIVVTVDCSHFFFICCSSIDLSLFCASDSWSGRNRVPTKLIWPRKLLFSDFKSNIKLKLFSASSSSLPPVQLYRKREQAKISKPIRNVKYINSKQAAEKREFVIKLSSFPSPPVLSRACRWKSHLKSEYEFVWMILKSSLPYPLAV